MASTNEEHGAGEQRVEATGDQWVVLPGPDAAKRPGKVPPAPGCNIVKWSTKHRSTPVPPMRKLTRAEVATHNTREDCWMVLHDNVVYDCTEWLDYHPGGGPIMMPAAGRNGTALYDYYHKWVNLPAFMGKHAVGVLVDEE